MVTKWAIPNIKSFDDIPKILDKRYKIFASAVPSLSKRPYSCGIAFNVKPYEYITSHGVCVRLLNADNWTMTLPFEQIAQLVVECRHPYQKRSTKTDTGTEYAFEEGKAYYERNEDSLTYKYNGEYIAIWDNKVLDHDTSFSPLAQRVYEKLGYVSIYMPFVTTKRRVLRFESPMIRRSKTGVC